MIVCPCCGSNLDRPLLISTFSNSITTARGSLKLQSREAQILDIIAQAGPKGVTFEDIAVKLGGAKGINENAVRTPMCLAKRRIEPLKVALYSAGGRGGTYRLILEAD